MIFEIKEHQHRELFLQSKGYYIEWMREDWLQEENRKMVKIQDFGGQISPI